MNAVEVADLLAWVTANDQRTIGKADILAWAAALDDDLSLADAQRAVTEHHGETAERIGPSHVNARCRQIRRDRLRNAGTPPIPGGLTHGQERTWRQLWCSAVKDGSPTPIDDANEGLGIPPEIVPAPDPERLRKILEQRRPRDEQAS
jgi:hypothetical protein